MSDHVAVGQPNDPQPDLLLTWTKVVQLEKTAEFQADKLDALNRKVGELHQEMHDLSNWVKKAVLAMLVALMGSLGTLVTMLWLR